MALWKKESTAQGDMYVNIFKFKKSCDTKLLEKETNQIIEKNKKDHPSHQNNIIAIRERKTGNAFFVQKKYREAVEFYNRSLCFTEIKGENISLAYANRSACFFDMKMYDKCLIDIQLAIKSGYPQNLMEKLEKRRKDAEKFINQGLQVQANKLKSKFEPNERIPMLANSVHFVRDREGDPKLIAKKNLQVGQMILMEPYYVGESYVGKYTTCNICLKSTANLIPCSKCVVAMFCHGVCENNDLHRIECGMKQCMIVTHSDVINYRIPLIRSIYSAARMFPTVDAMMKFVEEVIVSESSDILELQSPQSRYHVFLKMKAEKCSNYAIPSVHLLYETISSQVDIAGIFNTEKYRRFLMHLVMQHFLIINKNGIIFQFNSVSPKHFLEFGLSLFSSSIQHSCAPNVSLVLNNGSTIGNVIRPIEIGEELTFNRFNSLPDSYSERRKFLWESHGVQCKCERCELRSETLPDSNQILARDPHFRYVASNYYCDANFYLYDKSEILEEKCVSFLNKYGREKWCIEIAIVIRLYNSILSHCAVTSDLSKYK